MRANFEALGRLAHETDQAERRILAAALGRLDVLQDEPSAEDGRRVLLGVVERAKNVLNQRTLSITCY